MSVGIFLLALIALVILEKLWTPAALKALRFRGSTDLPLAEPGQVVTWSGTVENESRLPIPFVRLRESFPAQAQVSGDRQWIENHCQKGIREWYVEEKMSLKPRQSRTRKVSFSFSRRGEYVIGSYQMSAGDLFGIQERRKGDRGHQRLVVMPELPRDHRALEALGGFLGDISVRRFILEDPILTVGFRDYTGREPMKAVSWTRTAMTGSLQVKQYDHTAERTAVILLNVEGGTPEELEACFRLTRMACEQLEKKKISFGLRTNGNLPGPVGKLSWLAEGLGSRHVRTILYALGRADYTCFYSFRYLTEQTLLHRKNNEAYLLITPPLKEEGRNCLGILESAAGNPVCVLVGEADRT